MINRLFNAFVLFVTLVVVVTFVAWKQQDVPITVTCGTVAGGDQMTAQGITAMEKWGGWIHEVATQPPPTPQEMQRVIDGMFNNTLWFWMTTLVKSARGQKLDPQIIAKQKAAAKVRAAANNDCTPCPTPAVDPVTGGGQQPYDPKSASLRLNGAAGFSAEQRTVAATAVAVGKARHIPAQGWVVAIAAGLQESGLKNLTYGDRDSVGVLQQRGNWGALAQRMDVGRAFTLFYDHLARVSGWQKMPVTVAAQKVQVSAYAGAYAKWEPQARQLVSDLSGTSAAAAPANPAPEAQCVAPGGTSSSGTITGTTTMAAVGGYRKLVEPTSGVTYNVPIPAGDRGVAINFALDQVAAGKWYKFGSRGPDTFDCSGLLTAAWGKAGVSLIPQSEQMRATIPLVATAQPGDIYWHPGHVQMDLGTINGQHLILEAPRTGSRLRVRPQWMTPQAILDPTQIKRRA